MTKLRVQDVRVGDRVRGARGTELTVTRIDTGLLGRDDLIALVEDSDEQWMKLPVPLDGEVELLERPEAAAELSSQG